MGFIVFIAIVVGLFVAFLAFRALTSQRGPTTPVVRISIAAGEAEARMWQRSLTDAKIWSRIIGSTGDPHPIAYQHALWVKANDEALARDILGLDEEQ